MHVLEILPKDYDESNGNIVSDGRIDAAFRKINKNAVGLHIWKIENDRVEAVPRNQYGIFQDENCYIIYAASLKGTFVNQETICRDIKSPTSPIERNIHFWLGANTSTEKSGTVAYKVIELDIQIGNNATQYREVQGNESFRFQSYFKQGGITILTCTSSIPSTTYPRLFQISGKNCPICLQKESIDWTHFSSGHIMILQTLKYIFVWIGRSSSSTERIHALNIANKLRDSSQLTEISIVDDGYEQSMKEIKKMEWNKYLNLSQRIVHPIEMNGSLSSVQLKLFKCGYSNGKYRIEEIKTNSLEQNDLKDADSAYIVDAGHFGVWIWVGRSAKIQEKVEAMRNARGFVKKKKYNSNTPVVRVIDGFEPLEFILLFPTWIDSENNSSNFSKMLGKLDSLTLMQRPKVAAQTQLIDDGSGELKIYRINSNKMVELPKTTAGSFYSGDCFIILYEVTYPDSNLMNQSSTVKQVVYLWSGSQSNPEDKLTGEILLLEICDRLGKSSIQIRISEGFEPPHFLQIFKGTFIIFNGKSTEFDSTGLNTKEPSTYVLKVYGNSSFSSKAIQVNNKTIYTSQDCFVLKTSNRELWVWCGQSSTGDSREMAKSIGSSIGEYTLVVESSEPEEFWIALNEKSAEKFKWTRTNKIDFDLMPAPLAKNQVALFSSFLKQGTIQINQIIGFDQKNLNPEDIFLLDAGNIIYIWIGSLSCHEEKTVAWQMANTLITTQIVPRDPGIPIALIKQGHEPPTFIGFFENWDQKLWTEHQSFEELRQQIEQPDAPVPTKRQLINCDDCGDDFDKHQKYPIDILRGEADTLPKEVDPKRKEVHLTHDDFVSIFLMKFSEFEILPGWKKQELKKKYKLF